MSSGFTTSRPPRPQTIAAYQTRIPAPLRLNESHIHERQSSRPHTGAAGSIGTVPVDRFLANDDTVLATDIHQDVLDFDRTGHLAVLVNCAGSFPIIRFEDMTTAQWSQVAAITDAPMTHFYGTKVGADTYHHDRLHPSTLRLHERPRD